MNALLAVLMLLGISACGGGGDDSVEPTPAAARIDIPASEVTNPVFKIEGGTSTVTFTATQAWTVTMDDAQSRSWLSVTPTSGSAGTYTLTITAVKSDEVDDRTASVIIKSGTASRSLSVTQHGILSVSKLTLDKTTLTLSVGESAQLTPTLTPASTQTLTWKSGDENIVTVTQDGVLTAKKDGSVNVTVEAYDGKLSASCNVKVLAQSFGDDNEDFGDEQQDW